MFVTGGSGGAGAGAAEAAQAALLAQLAMAPGAFGGGGGGGAGGAPNFSQMHAYAPARAFLRMRAMHIPHTHTHLCFLR